MKRSQSLLWFLLAVVFAVGATTLLLSYMVTNPGNMMNELGGDCGKNYFTFLYHSLYGNGVWFEGMNYPYGEHIIYADGQPVLSTFLNLFTHVNAHQALAVMNLVISFSYVLAILFTYKILKKFGVSPFLAILFACLINMLAPQVMRLRAHFALAYLCTIPMLFYWTLLYHYSGKWKYMAYIFVMGFIISFIHLYTGALIFIWSAAYVAGYFIFIRSSLRSKLRHTIPVLAATAGLFVAIKVTIALTDPILDRPAFPLNTLENVSHLKDVYSSPIAPLWQYLKEKKIFTKISENGEGYTYIGVAALLIIFISVCIWIMNRLKKKPYADEVISEGLFSPVWLFVGACSMLLAMGAPFVWHMEWLLNYLSLFKQFRAMGRFSWVFYYVATIYSVVTLYQWYVKSLVKHKFAAYAIIVSGLVVWSIDVSGYVKFTHAFIATGLNTSGDFFQKNEKKWPDYLAEHHFKGDDFQAIILLPLFVSGSEKLWVGGDPSWPLSIGMKAAIEMHLPIVDIMMSRTSWSLTEKQVKTGAGPYADKPVLHEIKSRKPFLLLQFDDLPIEEDQKYLINNSELIGHEYRMFIYACYPDKILAADKKNADSARAILPYMHTQDSCITDKGAWYVNHFDSDHSGPSLFGGGSSPLIPVSDTTITIVPVRPSNDQLYEFSCWFLLEDKDYRSPYVNIISLDSAGKAIDSRDALTKESFDNYGMWFRASRYFTLKANSRFVKCVLMNLPNNTYIRMDEMLLRPADAVIVSRSADGKVMINNHLSSNQGN